MKILNLLIAVFLLFVIFGLFRYDKINKETLQKHLNDKEVENIQSLAESANKKIDMWLEDENKDDDESKK